jgi:hypothetical protein
LNLLFDFPCGAGLIVFNVDGSMLMVDLNKKATRRRNCDITFDVTQSQDQDGEQIHNNAKSSVT